LQGVSAVSSRVVCRSTAFGGKRAQAHQPLEDKTQWTSGFLQINAVIQMGQEQ
jgi:hypothetical protein